jgi:hypothetical protein
MKFMQKPGFARILLLGLVLSLMGFAPPTQGTQSLVDLSIANVGFDGLFRENFWFPLRIEVGNNGDDMTGRLVVRPETSGNAFTNTWSVPIELPARSRKAVFLYLTARSFANRVRVELIDDSGLVVTSQEALMRGVLAQDQLYVAVTQSSIGSVDLTGVRVGGYNAFQGNWLIENIPDRVVALNAVDMILFSDVDTGTLTGDQRQALEDWVTQGGHLLVTGGANWQATSAGLNDLLPLVPDNSETTNDLSALAGLTQTRDADLSGETIIVTGPLTPDAEVLAATTDGLPLVARRYMGLGVVDYLTIDPLTQSLRAWSGLTEMWFTLASSVSPHPSWTHGITNTDRAVTAAEILPGFNLLPDVLPLCGFLAIYVALIGPLNYVVLNRINRREYAWLTIPLFILGFTVLAWVVGFNLRGNIATISRLAVVQSWPDSERAQVDGLVGLLSPRRASYTLAMGDNSFLRPLARSVQTNPFASNIQTATDIRQTGVFQAENFSVDASFIATFNTTTMIDKPALSGQVSLLPGDIPGQQVIRGSVRNDSDQILTDPVILARGIVLRLGESLQPGDVQTFDLILSNENEPPAPSPLERSSGEVAPRLSFQRFSQDSRTLEQTVIDILGDEKYEARAYISAPGATTAEQELRRRQFFLSSFSGDSYLSSGRGDRVYLVGWSDATPLQTELTGATWEAIDTTFHIIELAVESSAPVGNVLIPGDRFTWVALERNGLTTDIAPINTVLQPGDEAIFRFTPIRGSVLAEVRELRLRLDSSGAVRSDVPLELWDWEAGEWMPVEMRQTENSTTISLYAARDPARFLGPQNAVEVRLTANESGGYLRIGRLSVEQEGVFEAS